MKRLLSLFLCCFFPVVLFGATGDEKISVKRADGKYWEAIIPWGTTPGTIAVYNGDPDDPTPFDLQPFAAGVTGGNDALYTATASATVGNTDTETTLIGSGVGSLTTPANYFAAGTTLKMTMTGAFSAGGLNTLTIRVKAGAVAVSEFTFTPASTTAEPFQFEALVTCRTAGVSGTVISNPMLLISTVGTTVVQGSGDPATTTATVDTTGTLAWSVTAEWDTPQVGDTLTATTFSMFTPGTGLKDPGSNGLVERTSLNTTIAVASTGTGNVVRATSPTLVTPALGTPSAVVLTNGTGLPIATGVSGLGAGGATFLATPSSTNFAAYVTGETGTGSVVFSASPTFTGTLNAAAVAASGDVAAASFNGLIITAGAAPTLVFGSGDNLEVAGTSLTIGATVADFGSSSGVVAYTDVVNTWADGIKQTFNPNATNAGFNLGSHTADPASPVNGDGYYNSSAEEARFYINGSWVAVGAGGGAPSNATYITQTPNGTLSNEQAMSASATGIVWSTTATGVLGTVTMTGTTNEIDVANGTGSGGNPTFSLSSTIDLGGKTSFEIPNGAAPTVDAFGEIAGDNNLWAASRGAPVFFDGTAATALVGVLVSDTPSNGQVPVWNTGGTITWETASGGSVAGSNTQIQYNNSGAFGAEAAFTYDQSANLMTVDTVLLNPISAPSHAAGKTFFDSADDGFCFYVTSSALKGNICEETWVHGINNTGSTIANGAVVTFTGASSSKPTIVLADADEDSLTKFVGVATQSITNGSTGRVTLIGVVHSMDTSAFSAGDLVYVSGTAGALTATPPVSPAFQLPVGRVLTSHASTGSLQVFPGTRQRGYGTYLSFLTSDATTTSTSFADVSSQLNVPVGSGETWVIEWTGYVTASAGTEGGIHSVNGPTTSALDYSAETRINTNTFSGGLQTAYDTGTASTTGTSLGSFFRVTATLTTTAAGTVALRQKAETGGAASWTTKKGASVRGSRVQ